MQDNITFNSVCQAFFRDNEREPNETEEKIIEFFLQKDDKLSYHLLLGVIQGVIGITGKNGDLAFYTKQRLVIN